MTLFPDDRHWRSGYPGYQETVRICPPHLRGLPVGHSYHGAVTGRTSHLVPNPPAVPRHPNFEDVSRPPKSAQPKRDVGALVKALDAGRDKVDANLIAEAARQPGASVEQLITLSFEELLTRVNHWRKAEEEFDSRQVRNMSNEPRKLLNEPEHKLKCSANAVLSALHRGYNWDDAKKIGELAALGDDLPYLLTLSSAGLDNRLSTRRLETAKPDSIAKEDFARVVDALWSEIEYQNNLPRRTADEAKDCAGFATLGRTYLRKLEDHWMSNPGEHQPEGNVAVTECLHDLRKLAAIFVRAMIYCGIRPRS